MGDTKTNDQGVVVSLFVCLLYTQVPRPSESCLNSQVKNSTLKFVSIQCVFLLLLLSLKTFF